MGPCRAWSTATCTSAGSGPTWDPALGFRMLALAGVTTGIDFGSTPETLFDGMQRLGAGINIGGLLVLRPGSTIPRDDPPPPKSAPSSLTPCGVARSASNHRRLRPLHAGGHLRHHRRLQRTAGLHWLSHRDEGDRQPARRHAGGARTRRQRPPPRCPHQRIHPRLHLRPRWTSALRRWRFLPPKRGSTTQRCTRPCPTAPPARAAKTVSYWRMLPGTASTSVVTDHRRRHTGRHSPRLRVGVAGERRRHRLRQVR